MDKHDAVVLHRSCEVLIIGGGPSGSTVASFLKEKGRGVVIIDKDDHPRFHIGESLLPMNSLIFERLGVLDKVKQLGLRKNGAEFISRDNHSHTFYFKDALNKSAPSHAYQVRRSEFDHMLLDSAEEKGVSVQRKHKVIGVDFKESSVEVTVEDPDGETTIWEADFLVDASGRNTYLGRKLKIKEMSKKHNSASIFGHYQDVERRPGSDEGNISIYMFEHGWFWIIPLADGITSVGTVCHPDYIKCKKTSLEDFFLKTIELSPGMVERMKNAQLMGEVNATGNFTYAATKSYGDRYLMVGDSFAFVDPVFSSGVFLSMSGAEYAADAIDQSLTNPEKSDQLFSAHEKKVREGIKLVSWFIHRFNTPTMNTLFIAPRNVYRIEEAVISMLAGDIYGDTPIKFKLFLFKMIYYIGSLKRLPASLASFRRRKNNTRLSFKAGTLDVD